MGGRYEAYPEYKDSRVEWLGEIPEGWQICKLKFMAKIRNGQDYKHVEADEGYPVLGSGGRFTHAMEYMYDQESVLLGRKGTIDKPLYVNEPFWTVDTMYYTEIDKIIPAKYLYYLAKTIQFDKFSTNTALPSMTQENLGNYAFAVPKGEIEKSSIANFLDHETAKIDTLIEKQQQLIALLKEKRQAVISHAVTKGLNPDAPMKDSGVEWLGEVPAHWIRIKFGLTNTSAILGGNYPAGEGEEGLPLIKMGNIGRGNINLQKIEYLSLGEEYEDEHILSQGDFLFNTRNSLDLVGKVAIWKGELADALYNSNILRISFNSKFVSNSSFMNYLFNSDYGLGQLRLIAKGTTNVAAIYYKELKNLFFALPPLDEQVMISKFIDDNTERIEVLIRKSSSVISLLQERRTALISAAVTGKIDVRNWQPPIDKDI
jgi:type I restriction enzyme S subunit